MQQTAVVPVSHAQPSPMQVRAEAAHLALSQDPDARGSVSPPAQHLARRLPAWLQLLCQRHLQHNACCQHWLGSTHTCLQQLELTVQL